MGSVERLDAVVVGAGHAGLVMSKLLGEAGVDHVVVERGRVAERWRSERWDTFTLLTPNWAIWLPGARYHGDDPDGFMARDDVVALFARYARSFDAPVREQVEVQSLAALPPPPAPGATAGARYRLRTTGGDMETSTVVVATGPFQVPRVPEWAASLPPGIAGIHSSAYRSPRALAPGAVVVVGSGASAQQIAEDLLLAGRRVFVCVGANRSVPRRYRGHDFFWWHEHGGSYEKTAEDVAPGQRHGGVSLAITGRGGGHDLSLRHLHARGATLLGRALALRGTTVELGSNLADSLAEGDRAFEEFIAFVEERTIQFEGAFSDPEVRGKLPDPPEPPAALDLAREGVGTVIFATGFSPGYRSWIEVPVLDQAGYPVHTRGATRSPGLYFLGLEWLHRFRSPFIRGAEEDARHLVKCIAADRARPSA